ncbi:MAG: DUF4162 domain-containing protein, partial [Ruminiclostridium sp.]|nr:DUF4162 domain-containing protein [Ruminiclostridium sp.]
AEIKEQHKRDGLLIEFGSQADMKAFSANQMIQPYLSDIENDGMSIILHTHDVPRAESAVIAVLAENSLCPIRLEVLEPTLESLFMEVVK